MVPNVWFSICKWSVCTKMDDEEMDDEWLGYQRRRIEDIERKLIIRNKTYVKLHLMVE